MADGEKTELKLQKKEEHDDIVDLTQDKNHVFLFSDKTLRPNSSSKDLTKSTVLSFPGSFCDFKILHFIN